MRGGGLAPHSDAMPAPLNDAVITAVAQLVDDAQSLRRDPSHDDLTFIMQQAGVASFESGQKVGKAKRVRWVLSQCLARDVARGEAFVSALLEKVRGHGGFRSGSQNYVGKEAVENAQAVFRAEGYELLETGELVPTVLDGLSGARLTEALRAYARRAQGGSNDAALLVGTGKDLLEATAKHVLEQKGWPYPSNSSFSMLLGQAFTALGLQTLPPKDPKGEAPRKALERSLFELACAVNRLRNKEGTGHGRPFPASVTGAEAQAAVNSTGVVAEFLLTHLDK